MSDNELLALETIHLFVELLDAYFSNVCELDIVFNFNKVRGQRLRLSGGRPQPVRVGTCLISTFLPQVYTILDEYILSGEIEESAKPEILERVRELEKLD